MRRIIFDVDGVLADFVLHYTRKAAEMGFGNPVWGTLEQQQWDFHEHLTGAQVGLVWKAVKESKDFWLTCPALVEPHVFSYIDRLAHAESVTFVTSRVGTAVDPAEQTHKWLKGKGICHPNVLVSGKKGEIARAIGADYLIDDKLENCWAAHWISDTPQTKVYILDRPYNRGIDQFGPKRVRRVATVEEFIKDVKEGK